MLPAVSVSSTTAGRTRFKLADPALRRSPFFEQVVTELRRFPGIESLEANRTTGSILVHHSVPLDVLSEYSHRRNKLFVVDQPSDAAKPSKTSRPRRSPPKQGLRRGPGGEIRLGREAREVLGTLGFMGFCGLGVYQFMRGQSLPAGLNLFLKGFSFLSLETRSHEPEVTTVD